MSTTYLVECTPNATIHLRGYKRLIEIPKGADPLYTALLNVWRDGGIPGESSLCEAPTPEQWAQITTKYEVSLVLDPIPEADEDDVPTQFNFIYWPSRGPDKPAEVMYNSVCHIDGKTGEGTFIYCSPYQPNLERLTALRLLDTDELINLVMRLEAEVVET